MNKLILLALVGLNIAACGQKGPLIVDQPVDTDGQIINGQDIEGTAGENSTATRIERQIDGEPSVIYR